MKSCATFKRCYIATSVQIRSPQEGLQSDIFTKKP